MDSVKLIYSVVLLIAGVIVFISLFTGKDDERKQFIKEKARSYSFAVVIGTLILEVSQSIFRTIRGSEEVGVIGISPLAFLSIMLIIYIITYFTYQKKYGG